MPKITIVGAGAYVFPLTEVRDVLSFPALQDATICMYDIDAERNNRNAEAVKKLIEGYNLPTKLQITTDRQEAVKDADFFICTFQVGGIEAYGRWYLQRASFAGSSEGPRRGY
jgi:alpha-galactosidase